MKSAIRYAILGLVLAALGFGAVKMLPASLGKVPASGHGHGAGEHAHGEESATMSDTKVAAAGIELEKAGPAVLREGMRVNGVLQPNQEALVQITPRFPGVVRDVRKRIGDRVAKGDVLAIIESNQSLTSYELKSPLAGTIIDRQVTLGEFVSEQKSAFVVADLSSVWADFSVPRRDLKRVKVGDSIIIDPEDGDEAIQTKIAYISPVGASETQSALARAIVSNADGRLRPGLFVTGRVVMAEKPVELSIKLSALQSFENRSVVFVRNGEKFEPRDVELGERDGDRAEVVFGLEPGDVYAAKNSFVIKAEIAKGTASHDH
jgi:multidrug efflux pump subunit AcrA (membrane-fusion protein)